MFFIAYTFKGQVHVFAGLVEIVKSGKAQYLNIFVPWYIRISKPIFLGHKNHFFMLIL